MDKLQEIKERYVNSPVIEHINGIDIIAMDKKDKDRLISTVEEQAEQINGMAHVIKVKNKEMRELSNFLKKRNIPLKELSPLITGMRFMEEQQKEIEDRENSHMNLYNDKKAIKEENVRLREALEFYADEKNHTETRGTRIFGDVFYDNGETARQALEQN